MTNTSLSLTVMRLFKFLLMEICLLVIQPSLVRSQKLQGKIIALQMSEPDVLQTSVFGDSATYQSKAMIATQKYLLNATDLTIRNFYALACIYFATNGVGNRALEILNYLNPIPTWITNDWLSPDYCSWFGITCNSDGSVTEIDLNDNFLYGSWPPEVVLLKSTLIHIDVSNNAFHYCGNYTWITKMSELRFLSFGTTSWKSDGVPIELNSAINLIDLDMSYSGWSEGPIRPAAFYSLINLEYLDMAGNTYVPKTQLAIPTTITGLPSLQRIYLDNCQFRPISPSLSFLVGMPSLIEGWMDKTKFSGSIPTELGSLSTLKSFSCSFCDLSGTLPTELGKLKIESLWLYANRLQGTIPPELGTTLSRFQYIFFEGNQLTGSVPSSICNLKKDKNTNRGTLLQLGVDCDKTVSCTCCTCCGDNCGNLPDSEPVAATSSPTTMNPTIIPTNFPTTSPPTLAPTPLPTIAPTSSPTKSPTQIPMASPTPPPTTSPSNLPTPSPSKSPTPSPTTSPSKSPTTPPTTSPSKSPTPPPTTSPSKSPTPSPTTSPSKLPIPIPTAFPTFPPTVFPTAPPTRIPISPPTPSPTISPTKLPTAFPTLPPTFLSTIVSTLPPSKSPITFLNPTIAPMEMSTIVDTPSTIRPTPSTKSNVPMGLSTKSPSRKPTIQPTRKLMSKSPTRNPTGKPMTSSPTYRFTLSTKPPTKIV